MRIVNSAAQIATAGGVQHNTWAAGSAAVDAVMERNSVANAALQPADTDASVWVHALYGNPRSSDLRAGNLSYGQDSSFYGLMMGETRPGRPIAVRCAAARRFMPVMATAIHAVTSALPIMISASGA